MHPICNTIGFVNNTFIIVDTHHISTELGGSGNPFIKLVHCEATSESKSAGANAVADWLEQRMTSVVGEKRGSQFLLHLVVDGSSSCQPFEITLSDEELLASLTPSLKDCSEEHEIISQETLRPTEHVSQAESLHPEETSGQEHESSNAHDAHDKEQSSMFSDLEEHEIISQETFGPTEHVSQAENLHPEETSGQEHESSNAHDAHDKQQSSMFSDSPLWQHPSLDDKANERTELLWKGHLTKLGLSSLKQFQLDALRA